ncbi:helix-turn-helix domain-containing protein [Pseudoduganella sp. R-34]|uniref:helix-turn-helix domain-containing protein n=1 Tax=unclassified Pseudoduganella TaxID=2637179 RepID=UPI003CE91F75
MKTPEHAVYNPDMLLDTVKFWLGLRYDAALADRLQVTRTTISKIRHRHCPVSSELLLRIHEMTGLPLRELRFLGGDFRWHTGTSTWTLLPSQVTCQLSAPLRACAHRARQGRRF